MATMQYAYIPSPVGELLLAGSGQAVEVIGFPTGNRARRPDPGWRRNDQEFPAAAAQLGEYFDGKRRSFDFPMQPSGTSFQLAVLEALRRIPYAATCSYAEIAAAIGRPKAVRAVGAANGRNPLPIAIPCHRVIGKDGDLTGFGGGLATKRYLLDLERRYAPG